MNYLRSKAAAIALGAGVLGTLFASPAVHATSSGCTQFSSWKGGTICVDVKGRGLNVESAKASIFAPGGISNWELRLTFFDRSGRQYSQYKSGYRSGTARSETYKISPNTKFREGRVCASVSENGVGRPGACVSIYP
jgi:hypothetical protein